MRYHYDKPDHYTSMYGQTYICDHPVYSHCTLYKIGEKGLAVIQQRYIPETKSTYWTEIDPWLVDALKKLSEERMLIFDESLMSFTMRNCIAIEDTNGNRKLLKRRHEAKIDAVAAMMDAFVAFKLNREAFE